MPKASNCTMPSRTYHVGHGNNAVFASRLVGKGPCSDNLKGPPCQVTIVLGVVRDKVHLFEGFKKVDEFDTFLHGECGHEWWYTFVAKGYDGSDNNNGGGGEWMGELGN